MKQWYSPSVYLPDQGKKILCMNKGDFYVAQRFANIWAQIPFTDSIYASFEAPQLWQEIDYSDGYSGYVKIKFKDKDTKFYTIDEIEKKFPEKYAKFIDDLKKHLGLKDEK